MNPAEPGVGAQNQLASSASAQSQAENDLPRQRLVDLIDERTGEEFVQLLGYLLENREVHVFIRLSREERSLLYRLGTNLFLTEDFFLLYWIYGLESRMDPEPDVWCDDIPPGSL